MAKTKTKEESLASRLSSFLKNNRQPSTAWTDEEIKGSIDERERNDSASRYERALELNAMFPNRVNGPLYQEEEDMSPEDAFELWLS